MLQCTQSNESDMKRQIRSIYARGNVLVSRCQKQFYQCKELAVQDLFSPNMGAKRGPTTGRQHTKKSG